MPKNYHTIAKFYASYPDESACLDALFELRFGTQTWCKSCLATRKFYRVTGRKCYACANCGMQLFPLAGTIFHRSSTSLMSWFYAMHLFSVSKNGVAAKELERHLGVTYKTAYRMAKRIRSLMKQDAKLGGIGHIVEVDETYIGGRRKYSRKDWYYKKAIVVGIVERNGKLRAKHMSEANVYSIFPYMREVIQPDTMVHTDTSGIYRTLHRIFPHDKVNHRIREYVRDDVHTNTIEGFWGQLKRSIKGTHHWVSKEHLQMYVDEFVFRYNHRDTDIWRTLFHLSATTVASPQQAAVPS